MKVFMCSLGNEKINHWKYVLERGGLLL